MVVGESDSGDGVCVHARACVSVCMYNGVVSCRAEQSGLRWCGVAGRGAVKCGTVWFGAVPLLRCAHACQDIHVATRRENREVHPLILLRAPGLSSKCF